MNSIAAHIDAASIVAQIRMERQTHVGAFVLVEGDTDSKRFQQFLITSCSIVICFGKRNLLLAIDILKGISFSGAVGIIDADFDRILHPTATPPAEIFRSQTHDFDLDIMCTPALDRYLLQVADKTKCDSCKPQTVLEFIMTALLPLSELRFVNVKHQLRYKLSNLDHSGFFDGQSIDFEKLIAHVSQGRFSSHQHIAQLRGHLANRPLNGKDILQFTSGHDVHAAIGIALRSFLGTRKVAQTSHQEIGLHLRLTLDRTDFQTTDLYSQLRQWEQNNPPYRLLAN